MGGEVVAAVLARGLGRRMRAAAGAAARLEREQQAAADEGLKCLVPFTAADGQARPFLDFVLDALADAGCTVAVLVVPPDAEAVRRRYTEEARPVRIAVAWAVQEAPRGTADAVAAAATAVGARPFLVVNADNLYPVDGLAALAALHEPGLLVFRRDDLAASGMPLERLAAFAMPVVSPEGRLVDIVEKPGVARLEAAGPGALVSVNAWRFDARIVEACRDVAPSPRGELELPDAVRLAMSRGVPFRAIPARGPVLDLTRREDIAHVAEALARRDVRL